MLLLMMEHGNGEQKIGEMDTRIILIVVLRSVAFFLALCSY